MGGQQVGQMNQKKVYTVHRQVIAVRWRFSWGIASDHAS